MTVYIKRSGEIRVSDGEPQDGEVAVPNPLGLFHHHFQGTEVVTQPEHVEGADYVFDPAERLDLVNEHSEKLVWLLFSDTPPFSQQGSRGYSEASGVWD